MIRLYKRKKKYWLDIRYEGKRYRIPLRTDNFEIAKDARDDYERKGVRAALKLQDAAGPPHTPTLSEFFDEYFKMKLAARDLNPATAKNEKSYAAMFCRDLGDCLITDIDYKIVKQWKADMLSRVILKGKERREAHYSPETYNNFLRFFRTSFNEAVRSEIIKTNPFLRIKKAKTEIIRTYLHEDEFKKLLDLVDEDISRAKGERNRRFLKLFKLYLIFLVNTGLRRSEAIALKPEQVRFADNTIEIIKSKTKRYRIVPLNGVARKCLEQAGEGLFASLNRRHVTRKFHLYAKRAGFGEGKTLHSLRHTFGTQLRNRNVDLFLIADLMGHKNVGTTLGYAKSDMSAMRDAVKRLPEGSSEN